MPSDLKLAGLLPAEIADRYDRAIKRIEELPVDAPNMDLLADVLELMADLSDIAARALPAPTELSREAQSRDEVVEECAKFIEGNEIVDSSDGQSLQPRHDGNRNGLAYAAGLRALSKSKQTP